MSSSALHDYLSPEGMRTILAACVVGAGGIVFEPRGVLLCPAVFWALEPICVESFPSSSPGTCSATPRLLREARIASLISLSRVLHIKN